MRSTLFLLISNLLPVSLGASVPSGDRSDVVGSTRIKTCRKPTRYSTTASSPTSVIPYYPTTTATTDTSITTTIETTSSSTSTLSFEPQYTGSPWHVESNVGDLGVGETPDGAGNFPLVFGTRTQFTLTENGEVRVFSGDTIWNTFSGQDSDNLVFTGSNISNGSKVRRQELSVPVTCGVATSGLLVCNGANGDVFYTDNTQLYLGSDVPDSFSPVDLTAVLDEASTSTTTSSSITATTTATTTTTISSSSSSSSSGTSTSADTSTTTTASSTLTSESTTTTSTSTTTFTSESTTSSSSSDSTTTSSSTTTSTTATSTTTTTTSTTTTTTTATTTTTTSTTSTAPTTNPTPQNCFRIRVAPQSIRGGFYFGLDSNGALRFQQNAADANVLYLGSQSRLQEIDGRLVNTEVTSMSVMYLSPEEQVQAQGYLVLYCAVNAGVLQCNSDNGNNKFWICEENYPSFGNESAAPIRGCTELDVLAEPSSCDD